MSNSFAVHKSKNLKKKKKSDVLVLYHLAVPDDIERNIRQ